MVPNARIELSSLIREVRQSDRDGAIALLATAVLSVLSFYYGSKRFFRKEFFDHVGHLEWYSLYEHAFWFLSEFILSFVLPVLFILLIHRKPLKAFGLGLGDWKFGLRATGLFLLVMLPLVIVVSGMPEFQRVYPHAQIVKSDWGLFIVYELLFILYFIGWEFIWRGYLLFGLEKATGRTLAVLIQMIPFVLLHNGKPVIETFGAILGAVALGILAFRTRSFWYCALTHWGVMLFIDLSCTLRERLG